MSTKDYPAAAFSIMLVCIVCAGLGHGAEVSAVEAIKAKYESAMNQVEKDFDKQMSDALTAYGAGIDASMKSMKQKGDLDAYLAVEKEKTRYGIEKTVPDPCPAVDSIVKLVAAYQVATNTVETNTLARSVAIQKQYVAQYDALIKKLVQGDKIDDAKKVKEERERLQLALAENESRFSKSASPDKTRPDPAAAAGNVEPEKTYIPGVMKFQKRYYYVTTGPEVNSWKSNQRFCRELGGYPVTIHSAEEQEMVRKLAGGNKVWLGASNLGGWRWVDGGASFNNYVNWSKNATKKEEALIMDEDGAWLDVSDGDKLRIATVVEWDSLDKVHIESATPKSTPPPVQQRPPVIMSPHRFKFRR